MEEQKSREKAPLVYALFFCCIIVIAACFYKFYIKQEFDYIVETQCDNTSQTCFVRDCSDPDTGCPPNNFSQYQKYSIKASDFPLCDNEDCTAVCASGVIECEPIECTDDEIDAGLCVSPVITQ